jgi:CubicO group peptidase (beta-lactamase class C family)
VNGLAEALDHVVPEILRITNTPGLSIAVAGDRDGGILERAYGEHDIRTHRPMTPDSIFPAGSMTKLYTAVAVLQLIERGVVGLHDPVEEHLDGIRPVNPLGARPITVHDLLTFRSGLAVDTTGSSLEPPPPLAEHVESELAAATGREYGGTVPRWASRVGEGYHYANLGLSLLGLLVERRNAEALDLPAYLSRHVIEPLGMRRTWLSRWDEPRPHPDRATGYACFRGIRLATPEIRSADFPANGLHTVPGDHVRLLRALRHGGAPVLRPQTVRLMLTPQVRMGDAGGLWPGSDWWTGLIAIMSNLGREDVHFGHPGSHTWGWWSVSRAYPRLGCAITACANGWDMMRWHNPANPEAAVLAVEYISTWFAQPYEPAGDWAAKRSHLAEVIMRERTHGSLGIGEGHNRAWAAGLLRAPGGGIAPAEVPLLLQDLGAAYGFPAPLWFWGHEPSASSSAAAMIA